jgi:hypothetical protein
VVLLERSGNQLGATEGDWLFQQDIANAFDRLVQRHG